MLSELSHELWMGDAAKVPGGSGAQAEDGCTGCSASVGYVVHRTLSEDLASGAAERDLRQLPIFYEELVRSQVRRDFLGRDGRENT